MAAPIPLEKSTSLTDATLFSDFVNHRKSEADREQAVLLADGPRAGKAEALAQPQHGLEALDRASCCAERAEVADPGHVLLHPKVVALNPLLQVLRDVMDGCDRQRAGLPGGRDGRRVRP